MTQGAASLSRREAWVLSLVATLTMAVSYVDRQTLAAVAPDVTRDLGIDDERYGWLASAFSIAYLVGPPLAGRWLDRVGARRGLVVSVLIWSVVAALHAVAPGFAMLFALRLALGLAESPSFPGAAQAVERALPPGERAFGLGVLFTGSSIGAAIAPPLAVGIAARYGWRAAFVGTAVVGLAWVPLWLRVTRSAAARRALAKPREAASVEVAASARSLLAHPAVLRAICAVLATAPIIAFFLLWSSKLLVAVHGLRPSEVGRYLWLPPVLFDVGSVAFGWLASRGRSRRVLFAAASALAVTAGFVGCSSGPWATVAVAGVAMAGGGGAFALLTSELLSSVPRDRVSSAGGITAAAQSLAYIVANLALGRWLARTHRWDVACVALALWVVPGCLAWLVWPRGRAERPADAAG